MNVLIAEDNEDIAEIYSELLEARKHKVKLTYDGQECVDRYKIDSRDPKMASYDVVVLDYSMPHKNGAYAAKEILKENPKQRIVFVSAFGKNLLHDLKDITGKIDFLTKPTTGRSLVDLVEGKSISLKEKLKRGIKRWDGNYSWDD
jgi:two-component system cell cycle response regulator CpdR